MEAKKEKYTIEDYRKTRLIMAELRSEGYITLDESVKIRAACSNKMDKMSLEENFTHTPSQQQTIERLKSKITNPAYLEYAIQTIEAEIDSIKEELHSDRNKPSNRFPRDQYLFMWVGHRQALRVLKNLEALLNTTGPIDQ